MKKIFFAFSLILLASCSQMPSTGMFGEKFETSNAGDFKMARNQFMNGKDTTYVITGQVDQVCQEGQCWLNLSSDTVLLRIDTKEKFKLPKDAKGKTATAIGHFESNEDGIDFITTGVEIK